VSFEWRGSDDNGQVTYSYRLSGYEDEWHGWGNETNATYTGLEDGDYEFVVRGKDNAGQITEIKWKFVVDTSSPYVVEHYPENDERNVPTDVVIRIKFSHPMDKKSVEDGISVEPNVYYTLQWKNDDEVMIYPRNLQYETTYVVTIKNARRVSGQEMADYSFSFTTSLPDTTPPEIVSVTPYYDELMDDIRIKFSEPMDALLHNAIMIEPWTPYTYSWEENNTFLVIHFAKYEEGEYEITLTTYLTDAYKNPLRENYSFVVYVTPPEIVYTSIEDGATNVGLQTAIEIKFSHEMMRDDVENNLTFSPPCNYTLSWNSSTLVIKMGLEANTTYHLYIPAGVRDIRGIEMEEPLHINFTTVSEIERKPVKQSPSFTVVMITLSLLLIFLHQKRRRSMR
jgi:hypothetical protein